MAKIRVLTEQTINQIAAGEVIENPASVVKELVENALDAKADSIKIEIKAGGFQLIGISDNGCGMDEQDAILCLERHATSKIRNAEDLHSLNTMGFRGEALASIAAVSCMTLLTATSNPSQTAIRIEMEGGRFLSSNPHSRTQGTTIEIRSLFYNTPARKKFQKTATASAVEIHKAIVSLCLAYPEVAFELIQNDQVALKVSSYAHLSFSEASKLRIKEILGESYIDITVDQPNITGFLGSPGNSRPNRLGQYLFINRRAIQAPMIGYAVKEVFSTRLDKDRFPIFVIYLTISSAEIDVNVHPQKKEVRFQDEALVKRKVLQAISLALNGAPFSQPKEFSSPFSSFPNASNYSSSTTHAFSPVFRETPVEDTVNLLFEPDPLPIGIFDSYLLLDASSIEEYEPGMLIVDLDAAQEQLTYDILASKERAIPSQRLLLPVTFDLSKADFLTLEALTLQLESLGFTASAIGKTTYCIEAIPAFLEPEYAKDALLALMEGEDRIKILARFARGRKKVYLLQEALLLWKKVRSSPSVNYLTTHLGHDAIHKLFTS